MQHYIVGARRQEDSKWEKPVSAKICGFLRKSAVSCGFLHKSATPKSLDLQSEPNISENLQNPAKICIPSPVSPFCCPFPFGAPKNYIVLSPKSRNVRGPLWQSHWHDLFMFPRAKAPWSTHPEVQNAWPSADEHLRLSPRRPAGKPPQ